MQWQTFCAGHTIKVGFVVRSLESLEVLTWKIPRQNHWNTMWWWWWWGGKESMRSDAFCLALPGLNAHS